MDAKPATEQIVSWMREHLDQEISMEEMAEKAGVTPFHFLRSFRRWTGVTPALFLSALRLEEAKRLLLTTDRSVTDICFDVGFTSRGTFSRTFREIVGEAPSSYRLENGPMVAPNCFQLWATRPVVAAGVVRRSSSFGDAAASAAP